MPPPPLPPATRPQRAYRPRTAGGHAGRQVRAQRAGAATAGARVQGALHRADLHQVHQGQDCQGGGERDAVDGEREGEGGRPADTRNFTFVDRRSHLRLY